MEPENQASLMGRNSMLADRKSVGEGKRVDPGGRRIIKKKRIVLPGRGPGAKRGHARARAIESAVAVPVRARHAKQFFFSSRRRHTRCLSDWSSDVCSSD